MVDKKFFKSNAALLEALSALGPQDVSSVIKTVKIWIKEQSAEAASNFKVGQKVQFYSKKYGTVRGKIIDINRKRVKLIADSGVTWRVAPTHIETTTK